MSLMECRLHDSRKLMRKRINRNPNLSLKLYKELKAEDTFGFGVKMEDLAGRVLAVTLRARYQHPVL